MNPLPTFLFFELVFVPPLAAREGLYSLLGLRPPRAARKVLSQGAASWGRAKGFMPLQPSCPA
jgi:hypothetical protein